jgi:hypothetical protein
LPTSTKATPSAYGSPFKAVSSPASVSGLPKMALLTLSVENPKKTIQPPHLTQNTSLEAFILFFSFKFDGCLISYNQQILPGTVVR